MVKKNAHRIITIIDPSRWGLRYGEKRQWYYKMRLDFFSDPFISGLKNDTKIVFLAIVSESLRSNGGASSMCLEYLKGLLRCSLGVVKESLKELERNNIIKLQTRVRNQLIEENRIEENRTKQNRVFDFEVAYLTYPKKLGKKAGMKKLQTCITTDAEYNNFCVAIRNYNKIIAQEETEKKYIKQFSTFVNCYEDYVDIEIEKTTDEKLGEFFDRYDA